MVKKKLKSPTQFLKQNIIHEAKFQIIADKQEPSVTDLGFNYDINKKLVEKKMAVIKKQFPLMTGVKLLTTKTPFMKSSVQESFSRETYIVTGYKRPYLSSQDVLIQVSNMALFKLLGAFRKSELKKVSIREKLQISSVIGSTYEDGKKNTQ
jgi:hypothetical protein